MTGGEDADSRCGIVRDALAAVPSVRGVQFIRQASLREPMVPSMLSSRRLRQQRNQSSSLQRHVHKVQDRVY